MSAANQFRPSFAARGLALGLACLPGVGLGVIAFRTGAAPIWLAAAAALTAAGYIARTPPMWRPPAAGPLGLLGLVAFLFAWTQTALVPDAGVRAVRGALLVFPVLLLAVYDLHRTGAGPRRRAAGYCGRLLSRTQWPLHAAEVAALPDVRRLREASVADPGPALGLLKDPREEVCVAGFFALTGNRPWRLRELGVLLDAAQKAESPHVRAAAAGAVGGASDPSAMAVLSGFLRDPVEEVRWAAGAAAVDSAGRKWVAVRDAVRSALADPKLSSDGPLPGAVGRLSPVAICDLTSWGAEAEPLGGRACRTLVEHYAHTLQVSPDYDLTVELARQITDTGTPPGLRVELGHLFRGLGLLTPDLLDRMTNAGQPGPIRLLAAEALLLRNPNDPDGLDALRGLARTPNREMALAIARVLQGQLGVDVGLPTGAPLPPKSKQAGEVARRVLLWATTPNQPPPPQPLQPPLKAWAGVQGSSGISEPESRARPKLW